VIKLTGGIKLNLRNGATIPTTIYSNSDGTITVDGASLTLNTQLLLFNYLMVVGGIPLYFYGNGDPSYCNPLNTLDLNGNWATIATIFGWRADYRFEISRAGDITLINDCYLKPANKADSTLPTPDSTYRGKIIRIEGGTGVADKLCVCLKKSDDSYGWFDLISEAWQ
jgi:hypothetical protein